MPTATLQGLPFPRGAWPEHVTRLAAMAGESHFLPGELIFHAGDPSSIFYPLISGSTASEVLAGGRLHATRAQILDLYSPLAS